MPELPWRSPQFLVMHPQSQTCLIRPSWIILLWKLKKNHHNFYWLKKCFTLTSASLLLSVATSLLILWYSWLVSSMVSSFSLTLSCSLLLSLSLVSSITTFFSSSSLDSLIALRHWLYELLERYNHIFLLSAKTWLILKLWYPVFFFNIAKLSPSRNSS